MRGHEFGIDWTDELGTEEDRERAVAGVADDQVGQAVSVEVGRDDLRRNIAALPPPDQHEATVAIGVERDLVIVSIHTGEDRALIRIRNPGDVVRRIARVDRDGGLEGARLAGNPLAIEDIPGAVDDRRPRTPSPLKSATRGVLCGTSPPEPAWENWPSPWFSSIVRLLGDR